QHEPLPTMARVSADADATSMVLLHRKGSIETAIAEPITGVPCSIRRSSPSIWSCKGTALRAPSQLIAYPIFRVCSTQRLELMPNANEFLGRLGRIQFRQTKRSKVVSYPLPK